jgi:hypothetical protein
MMTFFDVLPDSLVDELSVLMTEGIGLSDSGV